MPESAVVLLRASPQQYDQPHERKVDEIKENFTFAEHCNLDAEITALLMPKILHSLLPKSLHFWLPFTKRLSATAESAFAFSRKITRGRAKENGAPAT